MRMARGMARCKRNRFRWHLTDSAGWRIGILKYPSIHLLIFLPKARAPMPAFMGLNFGRNQIVEDDPHVTLETGFVLGAKKDGDNTHFAEIERGAKAGQSDGAAAGRRPWRARNSSAMAR